MGRWTEKKAEKGRRFREEREHKGLKQHEIGEMIGYATDGKCQSICNIEAGTQDLTEEKAKKAAEIFGVTPEYLLCLSDYRTNQEAFRELARIDWKTFIEESNRTADEWEWIAEIQTRYGLVASPAALDSDAEAGLIEVEVKGKKYFVTEFMYNKMRSDIFQYIKMRTDSFIHDLQRLSDPDLISIRSDLKAMQNLYDKLKAPNTQGDNPV